METTALELLSMAVAAGGSRSFALRRATGLLQDSIELDCIHNGLVERVYGQSSLIPSVSFHHYN
jgi:hypothetical protein